MHTSITGIDLENILQSPSQFDPVHERLELSRGLLILRAEFVVDLGFDNLFTVNASPD